MLPPGFYYTAGKNYALFRGLNDNKITGQFWFTLVVIIAVIVGIAAVIGRRMWNQLFRYKDVFEYRPYYTAPYS